jgi:hypothetical protein
MYKELGNIPDLDDINKFKKNLEECKFRNIQINNISKKISKSGKRLWYLYILSYLKKNYYYVPKDMPKKSYWDVFLLILSLFFTNLKNSTIYCSITAINI